MGRGKRRVHSGPWVFCLNFGFFLSLQFFNGNFLSIFKNFRYFWQKFCEIGRIWKYWLKNCIKRSTPWFFSFFSKFLGKLSLFLEFLLKGGKCLPEVEFFIEFLAWFLVFSATDVKKKPVLSPINGWKVNHVFPLLGVPVEEEAWRL